MSREYAVVSFQGTEPEILYRTEGFMPDDVQETIRLSSDAQLWISGIDEMQKKNEELAEMLRQSEDANRAKEVFLSNMSHDIRTPMNAIIGMTALAAKYIDEKPRVLDSLHKITTASSHLLSLINEVLDMSRINSGRLQIADEQFSLSDLLYDTLTIIRPQIDQKHHTLDLDIRDIAFESLYGDAMRLQQIYVNIINNAVKYTEDGGEIRLTFCETAEDGRCILHFICRDNGIGMSEEFLQKIFDPFERANTTTISKIEGTGLGMSIVRKLVEAMQGTIRIESSPGAGTGVFIDIPLRYEKLQINTSALADKYILIVEKDPHLQQLYREYLHEFNIRFALTDSPSEMVTAMTDAEFRNDPFDGVILGEDTGSGQMVFDLASYIHQSDSSLPVILVSSMDKEEIEYRGARSGISRFIPVPFFRKSLINGLNDAFSRRNSTETSAAPDLSGKHILLVEDNLINREIAKEILLTTNAEIHTAEDGSQAVQMFTESEPGYYDLILMDVQMPVMDGYEATGNIRASGRPDADVLIYAMTANTFAEDIAKARAAGMNGHIAKPIDISKLISTLREIV